MIKVFSMTHLVRRMMTFGLIMTMLSQLGCTPSGPELYPVTGKVNVNGKPAASALIFFHRKDKKDMNEATPFATAGADGSFSVFTEPGREGALPGEYVLTVVWPDMTKEPDGNGGRPDVLRGTHDKIPTSKLTASVKAGPNTLAPLELTLTAAQAAKPVIKDTNDK
jgi:hypothetical protein